MSGGAAEADVRQLAFAAHIAACLPYRRGDEPCSLLHAINALLLRRGEDVRLAMKEALEGRVRTLHDVLGRTGQPT